MNENDTNSSSNDTAVGNDDDDLFSASEEVILTVFPMAASLMSMVASMLLVKLIWRRRKELFPKVYHRTIFITSVFDIIFSANATAAPFLVPRGTPEVFGALGTVTTCDLSGVLWQMAFITPLYNAALSFYFVLQVRFQVSDRVYARRVEPFVHGMCFLYTFLSSALGLVWKVYNPSKYATGWCYPSGNPPACGTANNNGDDSSPLSQECNRGRFFILVFFAFPFLLVIACLVCNMIILYITVRSQEKRSNRYNTPMMIRQRRLSQKVGARGTKFIMAFLFTHIWPAVIFPALPSIRGFSRLLLVLLLKVCFPLQGLWIFIIYSEGYQTHDGPSNNIVISAPSPPPPPSQEPSSSFFFWQSWQWGQQGQSAEQNNSRRSQQERDDANESTYDDYCQDEKEEEEEDSDDHTAMPKESRGQNITVLDETSNQKTEENEKSMDIDELISSC